jgi:probable blue pigment (indigoidine) exporter
MKLNNFAFLAPCIWGTTYFVTTEFLPPDRPLLAAVVRALPAGLILIGGQKLPSISWLLRLFVLGSLNIGLFFVLLFVAAYRLPGGLVALVGSFQPLIVILLSFFLLTRSVTRKQLIAAVVGGSGVVLLISLPDKPLDTLGVIAALLATTSMASGLVLTKKWGRPSDMKLITFTGWQLFCGGIIILPIQIIFESFPHSISMINLAGYFYLAIPGSLLAYFAWFAGVEANSPVAMSLLGFISPIVALLLGFVFLSQGLSAAQVVGAVLIFSAILGAQEKIRFMHRSKSPLHNSL